MSDDLREVVGDYEQGHRDGYEAARREFARESSRPGREQAEAVVKLIGETTGRPQGERVPINIDADVRERLRNLLYEPEMRGVGYSEFIDRAIQGAMSELAGASTTVERREP